MAQPSSSHRERERDTDREHRHRSSSHHHHRTISSTTLLLVLSLVLAVLAVMLSLPSSSSTGVPGEATPSGVWNLLTPKRSQQLIQREAGIAIREAEVARREAELLVGAPGGVVPSPPSCPACTATAIVTTSTVTVSAPAQTVIKEVITENALTPPGWTGQDRIGEIVDRELKIVERERDIGAREASVNRREHDAARREAWIMEQLNSLGDDRIPVAEEIVYEQPKMRQPKLQELPSIIVSETQYETETRTVVQTQFVTVPQPASTRLAAKPAPEGVRSSSTVASPRTTAIEIITEEDDPSYTIAASRPRTTHRPPQRWFGA